MNLLWFFASIIWAAILFYDHGFTLENCKFVGAGMLFGIYGTKLFETGEQEND